MIMIQSEFKSDLRFLQNQMMQQSIAIDDLKQSLHDPNYDADNWRKQKELDSVGRELEFLKQERKKEERLREFEEYEEKKDMDHREEMAQFQELQRKMMQIAENMSKPVIKPNIIQLPQPSPPAPVYYPPPHYPPQGYGHGGGGPSNYFPSPEDFATQRSDGMGSMPSSYRHSSQLQSSSRRDQTSTRRRQDSDYEDYHVEDVKAKSSVITQKTTSSAAKTGSKRNQRTKNIDKLNKINDDSIGDKEENQEQLSDNQDDLETRKTVSKNVSTKKQTNEKENFKTKGSKVQTLKTEKESSKHQKSAKQTDRTPRMEMTEVRPEILSPKEDDIVVYINKCVLLPDNMNISKLYVYFYDQNDEEIFDRYHSVCNLDSDIFNPYYKLPIRINKMKAKDNVQLRMYILLVTVEEVANMTSTRNEKPKVCIAALSVFPLFIEGVDHYPTTKQNAVYLNNFSKSY